MGSGYQEEKLFTFDQLLRQRAVDADQTPLLAYPRAGVSDYELITGKILNTFVDGAAKALIERGFKPVYDEIVVGIYGITDLTYRVTVWGLARLGYTPFMLSNRLPSSAVASLLVTCKASILLYGTDYLSIAESVQQIIPETEVYAILARGDFDNETIISSLPISRDVVLEEEQDKKFIILHSSGSTGLPKPISFTHRELMVSFNAAQNMTAFQPAPYSHAHGLIWTTNHIYIRKTLYLFSGHMPQTCSTLTEALRAADPQAIWTVPYVLKLLSESQEGIDAMRKCQHVVYGGGRLPDSLGDMLINQGVFLGGTYGSTETSGVMRSTTRPREDKDWAYMSPMPHVKPYVIFRPVDAGSEVHELVVLAGHKALTCTNCDDPPGSYRTSDLFVKHLTIDDRWKFVGRADDRITLLNGEKVLPLPIEGRITRHALVREAVMFGIDKEASGLLLFRSQNAIALSDKDFLEQIWSTIEDANSKAEAFSRISREMIVVLGPDVAYPMTDKSSIKRALLYQEFAETIEGAYYRLEKGTDGPLLKLNVGELDIWITDKFAELGVELLDSEMDFFSCGVDSLKAIQMRNLIVKHLDLGGEECASMVVYDCGNRRRLAKKLLQIRMGDEDQMNVELQDGKDSEIQVMVDLIEKYSTFDMGRNREIAPELIPRGQVVVLTGVTGSLGSHILAQLILTPTVAKVYCLIRASNSQSAHERLASTLKQRNFNFRLDKVTALSSDLAQPTLGLSTADFAVLRNETTHIIHSAWAVNFALPVPSFFSHIQGVHNLLDLTFSQSRSARLLFCSSTSTAVNTRGQATISSAPIPSLNHAAAIGYARSKLVSEKIIENAVSNFGADATILRIGQIVPAMEIGSQIWNVDEGVSLVIRTAVTLGVLPEHYGGDRCTWLESDVLAKAILEIGGMMRDEGEEEPKMKRLVYNLVNPRSFSWKGDLLPALRKAGLAFDTVPWEEWLDRVRAESDLQKNPSYKLLGFWESQGRGRENQGVYFDTSDAAGASVHLRDCERVVDGGLVGRLVDAWRSVW